jgi:spermidine synthase
VLPPAARVLVLTAFAVAAAASMVDQVAWTRVLSLLVGPTTYAFTLMVSAFILGLALGGWLGGLVVDRLRDRISAFAGLEVLIGLSCLGLVPVLGALPDQLVDLLYLPTLWMPFAGTQALVFLILFLILIVPTALMGFAFPLVTRLTAEDGRPASRSVGLSASASTIGAICGSLAGGFVLVPWLGIQKSLYAAVALNVAASVLALAARTLVRPLRLASFWPAALVPAFLLVLAVPPWNMSVLTSGLYLYANLVYGGGDRPKDIASALSLLKPVFHSEGLMTTITVEENPDGIRFLKVGGKTDASNGDDMRTQLLLGHLPALFNPDASRALVIGLGSGVSVGAVLRHPEITRVDCVEISPEMVGAAHCFDEWNGECLSDPRTRLIVEDARNYLLLGRAKYDIICSEPSNPWIAGVGTLFTREFFELCRRSLESDGVLCQWVSLTRMRPEEFKSIVRTFTEVFPESVLLSVLGRYDFLLLGKAGSSIGLPWVRARETLLRDDVFRQRDGAGLSTPEDVLLTHVAGGETLRAFGSGGDLVTDDRNSLEMSMARNLNRWVSLLEVFRPIHELRSDPFGMLDLRGLPAAEVATLKEASRRAHEAAVATGEADLLLLENEETRADAATMAERTRSARARLERALDLCPTSFEASSLLVPILLQEGQDLFGRGRTTEALARFRRALRLRPAHREARSLLRDALLLLARASLDSGDAASAAPLLAEAFDLDPASASVAKLRSTAFRLEGKESDRMLELERAHRLDPDDFETLCLLVDSYCARGEGSRAIEVYERAVERDPRSATLHEAFAALLYQLAISGDDPRFLEKAASHGAKAQSLEPDRAESSLVLGLIRFSQGRFAEARDLSERTLAQEPAISGREAALRVLASALAKLGEREKALDALDRLLREPGVTRASLESDPILGTLLRERPLAPVEAEANRSRGSGG